jgi:hypothetical protein
MIIPCCQVPTLREDDPWRLVYTVSHMLLVWTLAMVPTLVLNAPVGIIARNTSLKEQKKVGQLTDDRGGAPEIRSGGEIDVLAWPS